MIGTANLRCSLVGGGMDRPQHFKDFEMPILVEGLEQYVICSKKKGKIGWQNSLKGIRGLGSSAARTLALLRYNPKSNLTDLERINKSIDSDVKCGGGWQDPIGCAFPGLKVITLHNDVWKVDHLEKPPQYDEFRQLYRIPFDHSRKILSEQRQDPDDKIQLRDLALDAINAVKQSDLPHLGRCITAGWEVKKGWHGSITNRIICAMELVAKKVGVLGYKVCGAGGTGAFLVIASPEVQSILEGGYKWEKLLVGSAIPQGLEQRKSQVNQ